MVKRDSGVQGRQKKKGLYEDKKGDWKEEEEGCQAKESEVFLW
jgi:hypothetical protein